MHLMKRKVLYILFLFSLGIDAQTALHNFGAIQIHDGAQMGFHLDLINDGTFNENLGLAGFYNDQNPLFISGTQVPKFFDVEIDVLHNLNLEISTEIQNSLSFINGKVITPRDTPGINLHFF